MRTEGMINDLKRSSSRLFLSCMSSISGTSIFKLTKGRGLAHKGGTEWGFVRGGMHEPHTAHVHVHSIISGPTLLQQKSMALAASSLPQRGQPIALVVPGMAIPRVPYHCTAETCKKIYHSCNNACMH